MLDKQVTIEAMYSLIRKNLFCFYFIQFKLPNGLRNEKNISIHLCSNFSIKANFFGIKYFCINLKKKKNK